MEIKIDGEFKGFDIQNPSEMTYDSMEASSTCYSHEKKQITINFNDRHLKVLLKQMDSGVRYINDDGDAISAYEDFLDSFLTRERLDFMFDKMFEKIKEQEGKETE